MDIADALTFVRQHDHGVLATLKADGRPQLSNINYGIDDGGVVRISITDSRAKAANLRRDPRASLHVTGPEFWPYVVLEADAELSDVASDPGDAAVEELIDLYRQVQGEHEDWDDYRRAMVADERMVIRLRPTYAYGLV